MSAKRIIKTSEIRRLASLQCTLVEAAGFLGISSSTLHKKLNQYPRLKEVWEQGQASGCYSLRRKQWRLADTSAPMAIHLGKVHLGQTDTQIIQHQGPNGGPVQTVDLSSLNADERSKLRNILTQSAD